MEHTLKVKIAFLYYTANLTQEEIAKKLGITRQRVNSIIGNLKKDGIVSVSINSFEGEDYKAEYFLEKEFGLNRVIIVPDYNDEKLNLHKVASVAARYLDQTLQNGDIIGVSWGRMLSAAISDLKPKHFNKSWVIQLLGAQNLESLPIKSDDTVRALANRLDCSGYMLYAPAVVSNEKTKEFLINEPSIQKSFNMMNRCNIGIFGIGSVDNNSLMVKSGYISETELKQLQNDGFCGDIGVNPIRLDGSYDNCSLQNRLISVNIECIENMDNAIGIASGEGKAEAVLAVLRSRCLNTLIIDKPMYEKIITILNGEEKK